jgi:hypothetical protein
VHILTEFDLIKRVINEWNPIEIYPLLEDEYEPEVSEICDQIKQVNSIDELAIVIHQVFVKWLGEDSIAADNFTVLKCYPIAKMISEGF